MKVNGSLFFIVVFFSFLLPAMEQKNKKRSQGTFLGAFMRSEQDKKSDQSSSSYLDEQEYPYDSHLGSEDDEEVFHERGYQCSECSYINAQGADCDRHIRYRHNVPGVYMKLWKNGKVVKNIELKGLGTHYLCRACDKIFPTIYVYRGHKETKAHKKKVQEIIDSENKDWLLLLSDSEKPNEDDHEIEISRPIKKRLSHRMQVQPLPPPALEPLKLSPQIKKEEEKAVAVSLHKNPLSSSSIWDSQAHSFSGSPATLEELLALPVAPITESEQEYQSVAALPVVDSSFSYEKCHAELSCVPIDVFFSLAYLKRLNLSDNNIKKLPDSIGNLSSLEEFYIADNQLRRLPLEIGFLRKLRVLDARNNKLSELITSIGCLGNLQILDISGNRLPRLPREIVLLNQLQTLRVARNRINVIPLKMHHLIQLTDLDLSNNNLGSAPCEQLRQLPQLQRLLV